MPNLTAAILLIAAQHQTEASGFFPPLGSERGDTAGYWQQRVAYTITATLDGRIVRRV